MGKAGLVIGTCLGFLARDQFTFNMSEKMDAINRDYQAQAHQLNIELAHNRRHL